MALTTKEAGPSSHQTTGPGSPVRLAASAIAAPRERAAVTATNQTNRFTEDIVESQAAPVH